MLSLINNTTYKVKEFEELHNEVGDIKQDEFFPQIKMKKWDNECNFSVRYSNDIKDSTYEEKDNKVVWKKGDEEVRIFNIEPSELYDDEGAYEIDVILNKKPISNIVKMSIQTKNLFFSKQLYDDSPLIYQPENVINSYAIYHSAKEGYVKGGVNYGTGKIMHIYRPYAEDNNGDRVWCDLNIDEENETLEIIVPQDFIDNAIYPILIDPIFGNNTIGSVEITPTSGVDVRLISIYVGIYGKMDTFKVYCKGGSIGTSDNVQAQLHEALGSTKDQVSWSDGKTYTSQSSFNWAEITPSGTIQALYNSYLITVGGASTGSFPFKIKADAYTKGGILTDVGVWTDTSGLADNYFNSSDYYDYRISAYSSYDLWGFTAVNSNNYVIIDGKYNNFIQEQSGSATLSSGLNAIALSGWWSTYNEVMYAIQPRSDNYITCYGLGNDIGGPTDGIAVFSENSSKSHNWVTFTDGIDSGTSGSGYGLEIYNESGHAMFSSVKAPMNIVGVYSLSALNMPSTPITTDWTTVTAKTIGVVDSSNYFIILDSGTPLPRGYREQFGSGYPIYYQVGFKINTTTSLYYNWVNITVPVGFSSSSSYTVDNTAGYILLELYKP